jgi:hypothetical protein
MIPVLSWYDHNMVLTVLCQRKGTWRTILSVIMLSVIKLSDIMLSVIMLSVIMLSVAKKLIMLSVVVMLSVVTHNAVKLNVVAPILVNVKQNCCPKYSYSTRLERAKFPRIGIVRRKFFWMKIGVTEISRLTTFFCFKSRQRNKKIVDVMPML